MSLKRKTGSMPLELLKKEQTDIIISDWIMPEMTGIEFLKACKDDDSIKHIPFIMVTAEAQKECIMGPLNPVSKIT